MLLLLAISSNDSLQVEHFSEKHPELCCIVYMVSVLLLLLYLSLQLDHYFILSYFIPFSLYVQWLLNLSLKYTLSHPCNYLCIPFFLKRVRKCSGFIVVTSLSVSDCPCPVKDIFESKLFQGCHGQFSYFPCSYNETLKDFNGRSSSVAQSTALIFFSFLF